MLKERSSAGQTSGGASPVARGEAVASIAGVRGVALKTVETHRAHIMDRLEIRDLAGLVRYAIRIGTVSP
jgi:DNA-binding NarL/FixJ family response regulator